MIPASLVIAADRGSLKAYQVNETPTRGPSLKLIQAFDITDAHGKLIDKVTDLAGRFPVTESAGAHRGAASIAESKLETETDRRINKELADQIAKIVNDSQGRLGLRRVIENSFRDCRSSAGPGAQPNRRAREIRSGKG